MFYKMKKQLEELRELLEHISIYEMVEHRKTSPAKNFLWEGFGKL